MKQKFIEYYGFLTQQQQSPEKKFSKKEYQNALDLLIEKFNSNNANSFVKLEQYTEDPEIVNAFFVSCDFGREEVYLQTKKYKNGEVKIYLNSIFYNDLDSMLRSCGIDHIEWQEDKQHGQIVLSDK